jgi:hypothetical protein
VEEGEVEVEVNSLAYVLAHSPQKSSAQRREQVQ